MRPRFGLMATFGFVLAIALSAWSAPVRAMALPAASGLKDAAAAVDTAAIRRITAGITPPFRTDSSRDRDGRAAGIGRG